MRTCEAGGVCKVIIVAFLKGDDIEAECFYSATKIDKPYLSSLEYVAYAPLHHRVARGGNAVVGGQTQQTAFRLIYKNRSGCSGKLGFYRTLVTIAKMKNSE